MDDEKFRWICKEIYQLLPSGLSQVQLIAIITMIACSYLDDEDDVDDALKLSRKSIAEANRIGLFGRHKKRTIQ